MWIKQHPFSSIRWKILATFLVIIGVSFAITAALLTGLVKLEQVKQAGDFLTGIFPLLFVPTVAGVVEVWDIIAPNLVPIAIVLLPVTWAVMAVAGRVTQAIMERRGSHE